MGRFDGYLICTDLDGTLYKNDKTISRENKEAIAYFKKEGGYFTFITGRMPYYSLDAYNAVEPNVAFGCVNGGALYDGEKKEYIWTNEMPPSVLELVKYIDEQLATMGIQVCVFNRTYFIKENETMKKFRETTKVPNCVRHYSEVKEPIAKILFGSSLNEDILALERILKSHPLADSFEFVRSSNTLFEILPKGVNKGWALSKLARHLNVEPKKTIAVGDYNNDIGMFKAAGLGIAVSNACKEALDAADLVTVSNEEHAIARVIYDLESGIYGI